MATNTPNKFTGGYDMRFQQLAVELQKKEALLRLNWFKKYMIQYFENVPQHKKPRNLDQLLKALKEDRALNRKEMIRSVVLKRGPLPLPPPDESAILETMRPVPAEERAILYRGCSQVGEGRELYLKTRLRHSPPEKYYFPEISSFLYGWNGAPCVRPQYGRSTEAMQLFYRRQGALPDTKETRPIQRSAPTPMEQL